MDTKKIFISYESQDIKTAKKLSDDLIQTGLQTTFKVYNGIDDDVDENITDIVHNHSNFLALLSGQAESLPPLLEKFLTENGNLMLSNENFFIPVATTSNTFHFENINKELLPKISLSLIDYDNCLTKILNKINPPQLKSIDEDSERKFQWQVTSGLFNLPEERRIEICINFCSEDFGLDLPTDVLCKQLLKKVHANNKLKDLWEIIEKYRQADQQITT